MNIGSREYDTPEDASDGINSLLKGTELVDAAGKGYANTPMNLKVLTDGGKAVTLRSPKSKELLGTVTQKE
ncbi:MAG: hypothetical protein SA339_05365 [Methanomassiliicoccus sp.]|nr:hypothetical protein [Methanomassiliicoccus sp.]